MPQIVWTTDADGTTTYFNARWYEYTGSPGGSLTGAADAHPSGRPPARAARLGGVEAVGRDVRDGVPAAPRRRRLALAPRSRASPIRDADGTITGWVGTATDIEDRRLAEEQQRFLAEAAWVLGSSLDYEPNLAEVARLAVRRIADVCIVDLYEDGRLERLAVEHGDPAKVARARELQQDYPPVETAIRTGVPELVAAITDEALEARATRRAAGRAGP